MDLDLEKGIVYTHVVQLIVQSAGVANGLAVLVAPPEGRRGRLAVGAAGACPARGALQTLQTETLHQNRGIAVRS